MHFWICLFLISIICGIFSTQARPENLFTSDSSVLDTDAFLDNDSQWSSNELISSVPDLAMNPIAQDSTIANNDEDLSTDFLDSLFTTNPSDTLFLSSACNDQGSLTADFLQARDGASSCSNQQRPQAGLKLPNIYDGNFLPQGLGGNTPGDSDSSNEGSRSEEIFLERSYYGVDIPEAFRLREDLEICPQDIFLVFRTPVCENPVTGSIEEVNVGTGINIAPGFVWSHMINVIPCMLFGISRFAHVSLTPWMLTVSKHRYPFMSTRRNLVLLNNRSQGQCQKSGVFVH